MNINKRGCAARPPSSTVCLYVVQRAAAAVFTESGMAEIQQNLDYYRKNAKVIADALDECGGGTAAARTAPTSGCAAPGNMKSWEFFDWLLENCGVVGTPGVGFWRVRRGLLPPDRFR